MKDDVIALIAREIKGKNERMQPIYEESRAETLCVIEPVSRSEYFSAAQIGINPEFLAVVSPVEYHGEKILEYHGKRMSIYRTYKRSDNELELYIQLALGLNGGSV